MAYPMRWVKETLPPRPRVRWLLMTMRLSMSSLAGMERTLVAVGTARLAAMFVAVRADAPRSRRTSASGAGGLAAVAGPPAAAADGLAEVVGVAAGVAGAAARAGESAEAGGAAAG